MTPATISPFAELVRLAHQPKVAPVADKRRVRPDSASGQVLGYITEHPGCTAADIAAAFPEIDGTHALVAALVRRHLARYEGSCKRYRYFVVKP